ncbi:MAG: hypothetical protein AAFY71_23420 [Bacteroidota bacterium]
MNKLLFWGLVILISLSACDNASLTPAPTVDPPLESLSYDGPNENAPEFDPGTYEGAVRFPSNIISAFEGQRLEKVQYYMAAKPSSVTIKVYLKSDDNIPDSLVYSAAVTSEVTANSWNEHTLSNPLTLDRNDLWVSVKFSHVDTLRSLGCDEGPAASNGDWVLLGGGWTTLRNAGPNINWNIRAIIGPS